jgi:hypothetical protein
LVANCIPPAFRGARQRAGHHPGVVDQDVQPAVPGGGERGDRCLVGEVQVADENLLVARGRDDALGGALPLCAVADRQGHLRAGAGERPGGFDADAGRSPGHDDPAAGQADALRAVIASVGNPYSESRDRLLGAVTALLEAGAAAGTVRADVDPVNVLASLTGVSMVTVDPAQRDRAGPVLDLLMDGLRYRASG